MSSAGLTLRGARGLCSERGPRPYAVGCGAEAKPHSWASGAEIRSEMYNKQKVDELRGQRVKNASVHYKTFCLPKRGPHKARGL